MQGFIHRQVQEGHQVYIVCPAVEESETEGTSELKNVTAYAKQLQTEVFPDLRIGLVHGKLSAKAKEAAMTAFSAGGDRYSGRHHSDRSGRGRTQRHTDGH